MYARAFTRPSGLRCQLVYLFFSKSTNRTAKRPTAMATHRIKAAIGAEALSLRIKISTADKIPAHHASGDIQYNANSQRRGVAPSFSERAANQPGMRDAASSSTAPRTS